jgi:hypothetical protein
MQLLTVQVCAQPSNQLAPRSHTYVFSYSGQSATQFQNIGKGSHRADNYANEETAAGIFTITTLWRHPSSNVEEIRFTFSKLQVRAAQLNANTISPAMASQMSRTILITTTNEGVITSVRTNKLNTVCENLMKEILANIQFNIPTTSASLPSAWSDHEESLYGRCVAKYRVLHRERSTITVGKVITKYLSVKQKMVAGLTQTIYPTMVPSGTIIAHLTRADRGLLALTANCRVIEMLGATEIAENRSSFNMWLTSVKSVSPVAKLALERRARILSMGQPQSLWSAIDRKQGERNMEETALGSDTLQSLTVMLAEEAAGTTGNESALFTKYKALLYLHPNDAVAIGQLMAASPSDGPAQRILANACTAVGSPPSQEAMIAAIVAQRHNYRAMSVLLPALGFVAVPTQHTVEVLNELAWHKPNQPTAQTAQLMLGNVVRNMTLGGNPRAHALFQELVRHLAHPTTNEEREQLLLVMGNAGVPAELPVVHPYLHFPQPVIRSAALFALRWINSSSSIAILQHALATDPNDSVRYQAAATLGNAHLTNADCAELCRMARTERSAQVRRQILVDLEGVSHSYVAAETALRWAALHDSSATVRAYARSMMINARAGKPMG